MERKLSEFINLLLSNKLDKVNELIIELADKESLLYNIAQLDKLTGNLSIRQEQHIGFRFDYREVAK